MVSYYPIKQKGAELILQLKEHSFIDIYKPGEPN